MLTEIPAEHYMLKNDDWKYDVMPEIANGKNFADFVDPDILERLEALEAEEEKLEADGFYESDEFDDEEIAESDEEAIRSTAKAIRARRTEIKTNNRIKDRAQNRSIMPRPVRNDRNIDDMARELRKAGVDPSKLEERAKMLALARGVQLRTAESGKRKREGDMEVDEIEVPEGEDDDEEMDVDDEAPKKRTKNVAGKAVVPRGSKHTPAKNRSTAGMRDQTQRDKATQLTRLAQRGPNRLAKASESDRAVKTKMPKHLYSGKSSLGTRNHR